MIPWLGRFESIKSVLLYSIDSRISVLDRFAFKSSLSFIRPDLLNISVLQ